MRTVLRPLVLLLVPLLAFLAAQGGADGEAVPLAGDVGAVGVLRFEVRERGGGLVPARLTFVPGEGGSTELFPRTDAAPHDLAARDDVVYSRTGAGAITVPAGHYRVYASRGPEWSLAISELDLAAGATEHLRAELVHELDTTGWISADFHLHTRTFSGHGDANLAERVLSFLGEGLEFAVATDHNHHTDYRPTLEALGVAGAFATVTGNEVSTPIGHFNAFPLDPAGTPVDHTLTAAGELFRLIRAQGAACALTPVLQLNHPRLDGIDYFALAGLDPVTGTSTDPDYSRDFDSIEILNENRSLGYLDPVTGGRGTHGHRHSALADWFHLLDQGERYAAVGNSDSHDVRKVVAGYPRNFVRSATDDPARVEPAAIAEAVRAKRLFTTTGPFVEIAVAGVEMGGTAAAVDGHAPLALRVRAASWVDCDRAKVFVSGALFAEVPIPEGRVPVRLEHTLELCFAGACEGHGRAGLKGAAGRDGWVVVVVEGDDPLVPVLGPECRPLAITNPVWVDGDGDGAWTSPRERVGAELRACATPDLARRWFAGLLPAEQALALGQVQRGPFAGPLVQAGLAAPERAVRLAAARAAERSVLSGPLAGIQTLWSENRDDPFFGALLLRVLAAARRDQAPAILTAYAERFGGAALRRYADEILPVFEGGAVTVWEVLGPLDAASTPPAHTPPARASGAAGRDGRALAWNAHAAAPSGYVDLRALGGEDTEGALVYAQAFLHAPDARAVPCGFGSDDGGRVWLGERLLHENAGRKRAHPLQELLTLELQPGWNRVVVEIRNGTGEFGFYFRVFDPGVEASAAPR